ncbi:unnamed protein product, partial [marine sediment metagenome]
TVSVFLASHGHALRLSLLVDGVEIAPGELASETSDAAERAELQAGQALTATVRLREDRAPDFDDSYLLTFVVR